MLLAGNVKTHPEQTISTYQLSYVINGNECFSHGCHWLCTLELCVLYVLHSRLMYLQDFKDLSFLAQRDHDCNKLDRDEIHYVKSRR